MESKIVSVLFVLFLLSGGAAALTQEDEEVPEGPTHLRAFTRFEGAMGIAELSWHDESENELGFEILRGDNGGEFHQVGMVGANTTGYEDKVGKYIAGTYVYKIRAFNQAGQSEDSNIVSIWF